MKLIKLFEEFNESQDAKPEQGAAYIKIAFNNDSNTVDNTYVKEKIKDDKELDKFLRDFDKSADEDGLWIQAMVMLDGKFYTYEDGDIEETDRDDFDNSFGPDSTSLDEFE